MLKSLSIGHVFDIRRDDDGKLHAYHAVHESITCAALLAVVGGFLDAYTYISRGGVFANAQTGNIVCLGIYTAQGEWKHAFAYLPPIIAFVAGVLVSSIIKNHSRLKLCWARAVLLFETVILFIIGLLPYGISDMLVNVTISFIASVQVSSFRRLVGAPYCSTMTTGNLRSATDAVYEAFTQRNRDSAIRAIRYGIVIFSFIFGGFFGGWITVIWGGKAVWTAVLILISTMILFNIQNEEPALVA